MNLTFNTGVPAAANNPSNDQNPMRVNNVSNAAIWNVDHFGFGLNEGGWHNIIHLPAQLADPAPATSPVNAGQLYTKTVSGDLELFYESSGGIISQLTATGITPTPGVNGYTFLPGGILLQWGVINFSASSALTGSVLFTTPPNIAFPNNIFNVEMTVIGTSGSPQTLQINNSAPPSTTGFSWRFTSAPNSGSYIGFFWFAIGN
jgi:hypothetical protein